MLLASESYLCGCNNGSYASSHLETIYYRNLFDSQRWTGNPPEWLHPQDMVSTVPSLSRSQKASLLQALHCF